MLFNSLHFILFFPIVVMLFYAISHKYRWMLLLIASYYFYMCWKPEYVLLIIGSTIIDFWAAKKIYAAKAKASKQKYLLLSLFVNLGVLFGFKYFNFFGNSINEAFQKFNVLAEVPYFDVLLPVGISFYTFQTLSYTIEVYRGKQKAETHLGIFAVYVSFFPQLVAGPIERPGNLLPQFRKKIKFSYYNASEGLKLMLFGFFKKLVIADRLAVMVDLVYNNPTEYYGISIIIATIFFAFQIYCDFSGYSDIAIGAAKIMGYDLMKNFNRPYFSKTIKEFWARWHISLSSWFKDYLYISLGGNRVGKTKWLINLYLVFLISGLWHGANWTFIIWGSIHGLYLVCGIVFSNWKLIINKWFFIDKFSFVKKIIDILIVFALANFAWIFFRANSLSDAILLIKNIFNTSKNIVVLHDSRNYFYITLLMIGALLIFHLLERKKPYPQNIANKPIWARWLLYMFLLWSILIFGSFGNQVFIYFQF